MAQREGHSEARLLNEGDSGGEGLGGEERWHGVRVAYWKPYWWPLCFSIMHIVGIGQILPLFGSRKSFCLLSFYSVLGTRPGLPVLCRQGEGRRDNPVLGWAIQISGLELSTLEQCFLRVSSLVTWRHCTYLSDSGICKDASNSQKRSTVNKSVRWYCANH